MGISFYNFLWYCLYMEENQTRLPPNCWSMLPQKIAEERGFGHQCCLELAEDGTSAVVDPEK